MTLSEDEKALYVELVVQIAVRMGDVRFDRQLTEDDLARKDRFDIKGRIFEHGFVSDFEAACWVLLKLEALHPLNSDESPQDGVTAWPAYFRVDLGIPELREQLTRTLPASAPSLSKVIKTFLGLMCDYRCEVSTGRQAFAIYSGFEGIFDLFKKCDYVEPAGDRVKWTDKIAPEMQAIYAWNEDGVPRADLAAARLNADVEKMWRTMPPKLRELFFSGGPVDVISLMIAISQFWYDDEWQSVARDADRPDMLLRGDELDKARGLEKKFLDSVN